MIAKPTFNFDLLSHIDSSKYSETLYEDKVKGVQLFVKTTKLNEKHRHSEKQYLILETSEVFDDLKLLEDAYMKTPMYKQSLMKII